MLCPKCGTDVGDEISLCPVCEKKAEEGEIDLETSDVTAPADAEEKTEESIEELPSSASLELPKEERSFPLLPIIFILGLALAGFAVQSMSGGDFKDLAIDDRAPVIEPSVETEPEEEVEQHPQQVDLPTMPTFTTGTAVTAGRRVNAADSIAVYYPLKEKVEIAYYQRKLSEIQKISALSTTSLKELSGRRPELLAHFWLTPGAAFCSKANIERYAVDTFANEGGLSHSVDFDFAKNLGGIDSFSCQIEKYFQVGSSLVQSGVKEVKRERLEIGWEVSSRGPLYISTAAENYHFSSKQSRSIIVWDKKRAEVTVGYFKDSISEDEYLKIRDTKSLFSLKDKAPLVTVVFEMKPDASEFSLVFVKRYSVHFHRNREKGLFFPGDKDKVSFYYSPSTEVTSQISGLTGALYEAEKASGSLKHSDTAQFSGLDYNFSWDLNFKGFVADLSSEPLVSIAFDLNEPNKQPKPKETSGKISAGKSSTELLEALALYYPAENDVVVGFYAEPLSSADKKTIRANKSFWNYVNGKRPSLIVFIKLKPDARLIKPENVLNYRLVFLREQLGEFYFPGPRDKLSIKKDPKDFTAEQLRHLSGVTERGGAVALSLSGKHFSERLELNIDWDVEVDAKLIDTSR